mmetsp:Transcript_21052/g.72760  ORF Transcript_21052/g.72760 Transcript_21052/m.72760 type:complete len:737 (+) Transcript_21052:74-2284(+)
MDRDDEARSPMRPFGVVAGGDFGGESRGADDDDHTVLTMQREAQWGAPPAKPRRWLALGVGVALVLAVAALAVAADADVNASRALAAADRFQSADDADEGAETERAACGISQSVRLDKDRLSTIEWEVLADFASPRAAVYLVIPVAKLGRPFTVVATAGRVNGGDAGDYLHFDAGAADALFELALSPRRNEVLVTAPDLSVRPPPAPYDAAYAAAMRDGVARALRWTAALEARVCVFDESRGEYVEEAAGGRDSESWASRKDKAAPWPPAEDAVLVLDVRDWLVGGLSVLDDELACVSSEAVRITEAKAFPSNLELVTTCATVEYDDAGAVEIHYSLALLPVEPLPLRRADDRVGYFGGHYLQLGPLDAVLGDLGVPHIIAADMDERVNFIRRWRLECAPGPTGTSSAITGVCRPLKQITYHVDPSVPKLLWPILKEGILMWNAAFLEIGFDNAIAAVSPDDKNWPTDYEAGDVRFSSVSWVPVPDLGLAIGPSHVDARSGEILYANIVVGEGWMRAFTGSWLDEADIGAHAAPEPSSKAAPKSPKKRHFERSVQEERRSVADHVSRGAAALYARGSWNATGPLPAAFLAAALKDVVAHEVGHTLGLRHNFVGSALFGPHEIHAESKMNGGILASTVMDYIAPVVAEHEQDQGAYFMGRVGPYDDWCVRYGYSKNTSAQALRKIADEATGNPSLQRGDDGDAEVHRSHSRLTCTGDVPLRCVGLKRPNGSALRLDE